VRGTKGIEREGGEKREAVSVGRLKRDGKEKRVGHVGEENSVCSFVY
jgi:hypothetical protein